MTTTTFKGARYITKFADPIEWDATRAYEAIESVQYNGFTYISKQPVPVGVQIDNTDFWLLWADPNAQMEQLRQLVSGYVDQVEGLSGTVEDLSDDVEAFAAIIPASNFSAENTVKKYIEDSIKFDITKAFVFDTVADMKTADNIGVGAICHTNGFYSAGDHGAAWYEITDSGTANEMDVIACGALYAHMINDNPVTPQMFGAYADGVSDDHDALERCFEYAIANTVKVQLDGQYITNSSINVAPGQKGIYIEGVTSHETKITGTGNFVILDFVSMLRCNLKHFIIESTNANATGIKSGGTVGNITHRTVFDDICIVGCNGFNCVSCGYVTFNECAWQGSGTVDNVACTIEGEYVYFRHCFFEGASQATENIGINILNAQYVYIDECDIPNFANGIAIKFDGDNSQKNIYVDKTTFIRSKHAVFIDTTTQTTNVYFTNIGIFSNVVDMNIVHIERNGSGVLNNFVFECQYEALAGHIDTEIFSLGSNYAVYNASFEVTLQRAKNLPNYNRSLDVYVKYGKHNMLTVSGASPATVFTYNGLFPKYGNAIKPFTYTINKLNGTIPDDAVYQWVENGDQTILQVSSVNTASMFFVCDLIID